MAPYAEVNALDELIQKLSELLEDLGFDYDRLSKSGKEAYDEICLILAKLTQ